MERSVGDAMIASWRRKMERIETRHGEKERGRIQIDSDDDGRQAAWSLKDRQCRK